MMLQIVFKDTAADSLTSTYLRNLRMGCFVLFSEGETWLFTSRLFNADM